MRPISTALAAALLSCACGAVPQALAAQAAHVQRVAWTKNADGDAFRDARGVCRVFGRDEPAGLAALGRQVQACFEGSLPERLAEPAAEPPVEVAWSRIPRSRMAEAYAASALPRTLVATSARRGTGVPLLAIRGFFTHAGSVCRIVIAEDADQQATLGHEFKHCVDGLFHDAYGNWTRPPAERVARAAPALRHAVRDAGSAAD